MFDNKYPYTDYHELNLDWFMGEFKKLVAEWEETKGEWNSLHDYVQNYFENLNVQTEINNKINTMILDGTFADIVSPFVTAALPALVAGQLPDVVAAQISAVVAAQISAVVADQLPAAAAAAAAAEVGDWLTAHIDPDTGYVIDDTLTVSQAAADAKTVGDALNGINDNINALNILSSYDKKHLNITGTSAKTELSTGISGSYVNKFGNVSSYVNARITEPFAVQKGQVVCIDVFVDVNMAVATYCNSTGDDDYEVVDNTFYAEAGQHQFVFISDRNGYVCISCSVSRSAYYSVSSNSDTLLIGRECKYVPIATNDGANSKILINESNIVIPYGSRIFYGTKTYQFASNTTVNRVAYGSSTANNELLIFDTSDNSVRFINGNAYNSLKSSDLVVATFKYGMNGCSLPDDYIEYANRIVADINIKNPVEYVKNAILAQSQTVRTETGPILTRTGILNILHFSDIHGVTTQLQRVLDLYNAHSDKIHDILHSGDSPATYYENDNPFASVDGAEYILNIPGNHEYWHEGSTGTAPYNATQTEVYTKFTAPFISNWDVQSPGVNKNYWYKDYSNAGIRLIALDSLAYNSAQSSWLAATLADAITNNLLVLCTTHYPPQPGITLFDCAFSAKSISIDPVPDPPAGTQIERMPTAAYDAVDTFITNGGVFVGWICGHNHASSVGVVTSHTNQVIILVSTQSFRNWDDTPRVAGTKTQDSFNIVTVDTVNHLLKITNIGADIDKYMRHRGYMSIDYQTKSLVSVF